MCSACMMIACMHACKFVVYSLHIAVLYKINDYLIGRLYVAVKIM